MLNKRQLLRKLPSFPVRFDRNESNSAGKDSPTGVADALSDSSSHEKPKLSTSVSDATSKAKKNVHFNPGVRVTLIATVQECKKLNLHTFFWCSRQEIAAYQQGAFKEAKSYLVENDIPFDEENIGEKIKTAQKALYREEDTIENTELNAQTTVEVTMGYKKS